MAAVANIGGEVGWKSYGRHFVSVINLRLHLGLLRFPLETRNSKDRGVGKFLEFSALALKLT